MQTINKHRRPIEHNWFKYHISFKELTKFFLLRQVKRGKKERQGWCQQGGQGPTPGHLTRDGCHHTMQWVSVPDFFLLCLLLCNWNLLIFSLLAKTLRRKDFTSVWLYITFFQDVSVWHFLIRLSFFLTVSATWVTVILFHLGSNMRTGQGLANNGLQAKSSPSLVFVNKMLSEHSRIHLLPSVGLSSCGSNTEQMPLRFRILRS